MAIGAAVKAGQLGYRFAPSLMNFGRKLFSPGPWKMPHMVPKARGFGKVPKVKYIPATRNMAGARVAERYEPITKAMGKGYFVKHPFQAAALAGPLAYSGGKKIYGGLAGEEAAEVTGEITPPQEWTPPDDFLSLSEQARTDAEKGKSDMKKMLKYGFLIAAAGGNPSKFFERSSDVAKATEVYKKNERYANQFDAVFVKGNMPDNPKDAYERLIKVGMGPKEAMEITGQVAQLMGKTEMERAMNTLRDVLASQGPDAAAQLLVTFWSTGQLEIPDHLKYAKDDDLFQAAFQAVQGGGMGAIEPTGEEVEILG